MNTARNPCRQPCPKRLFRSSMPSLRYTRFALIHVRDRWGKERDDVEYSVDLVPLRGRTVPVAQVRPGEQEQQPRMALGFAADQNKAEFNDPFSRIRISAVGIVAPADGAPHPYQHRRNDVCRICYARSVLRLPIKELFRVQQDFVLEADKFLARTRVVPEAVEVAYPGNEWSLPALIRYSILLELAQSPPPDIPAAFVHCGSPV